VASHALSVVVPAYNEEHRLPRLLRALDQDFDSILQSTTMHLSEVLVVDDGSSDGTSEIVRRFDGLPGRLKLIRLSANLGKGAAVRAGMLGASGDRALITDADMSTPLEDVVALSKTLDAGADVAAGSRALDRSLVLVHQPLLRELMGKGFNVMLRIATGIPWRDTQCGFKLFRLETTRVLFEAQRIEGFAFDAEVCVNARRAGLTLAEVPVRWSNDPDTRVKLGRSSSRMALDALRLAATARRPWVVPKAIQASEAPGVHVADAPVVPVGLPPHG
jgi:dolichyl-phosphate beta-glucosyltransferase